MAFVLIKWGIMYSVLVYFIDILRIFNYKKRKCNYSNGLLIIFLEDKLKNILHILLIFCFSLTIISCGEKDEYESWEKKGYTPSVLTYTTSDLTTNTTYYWKVIASDTKGGSAESETWSFTVQ